MEETMQHIEEHTEREQQEVAEHTPAEHAEHTPPKQVNGGDREAAPCSNNSTTKLAGKSSAS